MVQLLPSHIAKIDIDTDDPYPLALFLMTLPPYDAWIRKSATKGTHLKIMVTTEDTSEFIRWMIDDSFRVKLDADRLTKKLSSQNVLWDIKSDNEAGIWIQINVRALGLWLLKSGCRSLRNAIDELERLSIPE